MRRTAICLMLLLLSATSAAAVARNSPGENEPCTGTDSAAQALDPAATAAAARPATAGKESRPATHGGGDSDMGMPRVRAPKWHSFLPGMFR
jgi:hypothetical protein